VNYISTVLLAILLLPHLKNKSPSGEPGRLTIINSGLALTPKFAHHGERPLLRAISDKKNFTAADQYSSEQYSLSKTLGHMFLWKLVDYVDAEDVIVNLSDPGFVKGTGLNRAVEEVGRLAKAGYSVFAGLTGRSVREGATSFVDAVVGKGRESHGGFIVIYTIFP